MKILLIGGDAETVEPWPDADINVFTNNHWVRHPHIRCDWLYCRGKRGDTYPYADCSYLRPDELRHVVKVFNTREECLTRFNAWCIKTGISGEVLGVTECRNGLKVDAPLTGMIAVWHLLQSVDVTELRLTGFSFKRGFMQGHKDGAHDYREQFFWLTSLARHDKRLVLPDNIKEMEARAYEVWFGSEASYSF